MTKRSKLSIKWKLFIYLLLFVAVTVSLLWIFETTLLSNFYIFVKTRELDMAVQNIQDGARDFADGDIESFENGLLDEARKLNAQITLYDADGALVYFAGYGAPDKRKLPPGFNNNFDDGNERAAFTDRMWFRGKPAPMDVFRRTAEIEIGGQKYTVLIEALTQPVSAAITILKLILVIITALLIAAAFIVSRLLYRKLAIPIIETTRSALMLAEGKRDVNFDANGYLEIESLNDTLSFAQAEIVKSDNLQREIIANVSHDLRTPLTLIAGYAEMMRDFPEDTKSEDAQVIIDESLRLTKLVNDMLSLSKLNSGVMVPQMSRFSLTDLIKDIARRYCSLSKKEGLKIVFEPQENIVCYADEGAISQVVYNLIANADAYGGEDKLITIEQKLDNDSVTISFTDRGVGLKEEELPDIWKRYKTGSGEQSRGMGLGLNIVSSILEMHGAEYGVINRPPQGATFWFKLKRAASEGQDDNAAHKE